MPGYWEGAMGSPPSHRLTRSPKGAVALYIGLTVPAPRLRFEAAADDPTGGKEIGDPMVRAELNVTIKRPVEEVFATMSDASKNEEWVSGVRETTKTSEGPIGVGTTYHSVGKFLGRRMESDITYTAFEPNRGYAFETTTPFPITATFTFEPVAEGTRVDQTVDAEPGGFFKLAAPLLVVAAKRQFQNDLDNLRDLMEADALGD